jgi:hypothetical protein
VAASDAEDAVGSAKVMVLPAAGTVPPTQLFGSLQIQVVGVGV